MATQIRDRLGPVSELPEWPLVSIVVVNRDGAEHLRRLFAGLVERTDYPRLELILVDNGSSDESVELARSLQAPFAVTILANPHNESFSDANNQGAERANGELLLFLNNDVEPFEPGWLRELVACQRRSGAGAVGGTLIYPDEEGVARSGYRVQSRAVRFRDRKGMLAVDSGGQGRDVFDPPFGEDFESTVAIGACLLVDPRLFWQVGGFTHGYFYGGEDDDLGLKLRERGAAVIYSGRSIAIHRFSSTSRDLHAAAGGSMRYGNGRLLVRRWGPRVWREWALDRLAGGGLWAVPGDEPPAFSAAEAVAPGFCLRGDPRAEGEKEALEGLEDELARRGHRRLSLSDTSDDLRGYLYDVAVYLRGTRRHLPAPGQLNVLWAVSHLEALSGLECRGYDLVVTDDLEVAARLREADRPTAVVALRPEGRPGQVVDAALERLRQVGIPTRIEPRPEERVPGDGRPVGDADAGA